MSVELAIIKFCRSSGGRVYRYFRIDVNGRLLVKPATTNIVVNLPDVISSGAAKFDSQL